MFVYGGWEGRMLCLVAGVGRVVCGGIDRRLNWFTSQMYVLGVRQVVRG